MSKLQFRILYRELLFRVVDLEILAPDGDITKPLGQFTALLVAVSLGLTPFIGISPPMSAAPDMGLAGAWIANTF